MSDVQFMRLALRLARRGYGTASPNPMVGAVLVKSGRIIGRGWHKRAGGPHAEIEALHDAQRHGHSPRGAILYVTLEPCCTHGRTPPCTDAIIAAGIKRVVVGTADPNPDHAGKGFKILQRAGIAVVASGSAGIPAGKFHFKQNAGTDAGAPRKLAAECAALNKAFNHWIVHHTPLVTVKAAMTLDGKIATANGESKWITGEKARAYGMKLRQGSDAILVGVNTILADDPGLTVRTKMEDGRWKMEKVIRRIVLDSKARTPLTAKVVSDEFAASTTIVVSNLASKKRLAALAKRVNVIIAPDQKVGRASSRAGSTSQINLKWLLKKLGSENVTSLLVEGGGEVNASFLLGGLAQRVAFFYAPKILGGRDSRKAVAGDGARSLSEIVQLHDIKWKLLGPDLLLTAQIRG
ncbi:MAG TPA: bifunctional diaminohydroxyphosphoribosylaminopyrimidine deaminase/5-amino-6-(5-phosphoribosylamino)uracil reductase RibD [Candidatus Binatia bacterium]|nr:bifunctional diaminohydroxyphosphoribosylaminopyrimidine deaminase/5-amino-6-(5-phosphoribosylamino)uracil reductase RibD [Candidatus Binatia bacterium]